MISRVCLLDIHSLSVLVNFGRNQVEGFAISQNIYFDAVFIRFNWYVRGLLEKYPTFGREKETGLLGALDT